MFNVVLSINAHTNQCSVILQAHTSHSSASFRILCLVYYVKKESNKCGMPSVQEGEVCDPEAYCNLNVNYIQNPMFIISYLNQT